ncbi:MAG: thioredoxin family protein [Desulfobacterales bacterium]
MENNRKMVIVFHADWCLPCQQLEKQTLSDPGAAEKLQKFKVFHVDMTHAGNPETMNIQQRFNVQGVPTMVLLDSEGNIAERIAGLISPAAFKNILSQVE